MTESQSTDSGQKETGRIEAFSDGVLAIVITLLAFDLKVPEDTGEKGFSLFTEILKQWPTYLAFLVSFLFLLVIWINHHRLFTVIRRTDNTLLLLNGVLLLGITLLPFATKLVALYLKHSEQNAAVVIYSGIMLLNAIFFNLLWRYASYENRLFDQKTDRNLAAFISRQYAVGPLMYMVAFICAFFSALLSLLLSLGLAVFFALPNRAVQRFLDESQATS